MLASVRRLTASGGPWVAEYNQIPFAIWVAFAFILVLRGVLGVYRTYRVVRSQSRRLARRVQAILAAIVLAVVLGAATNAVASFFDIAIVPLFSTTLALPGAVMFLGVSPQSLETLQSILLRRHRAGYEVEGAILTFSDGTLIGSNLPPGGHIADEDLFAATLDVIQNFMRSSVEMFRGKWIRTIKHGDRTLVMERGRFAFLTLVLHGEENDPLRRFMIERLHEWETQNREVLRRWRGIAADAKGTDDLLKAVLFASEAETHA